MSTREAFSPICDNIRVTITLEVWCHLSIEKTTIKEIRSRSNKSNHGNQEWISLLTDLPTESLMILTITPFIAKPRTNPNK